MNEWNYGKVSNLTPKSKGNKFQTEYSLMVLFNSFYYCCRNRSSLKQFPKRVVGPQFIREYGTLKPSANQPPLTIGGLLHDGDLGTNQNPIRGWCAISSKSCANIRLSPQTIVIHKTLLPIVNVSIGQTTHSAADWHYPSFIHILDDRHRPVLNMIFSTFRTHME